MSTQARHVVEEAVNQYSTRKLIEVGIAKHEFLQQLQVALMQANGKRLLAAVASLTPPMC